MTPTLLLSTNWAGDFKDGVDARSKFEVRNPKQIRISNVTMTETVELLDTGGLETG